jgi:nucleoside-diphosphate-sugar epimerase
LANGRITVFGGNQTRPNIHIQDITDVFIHSLNLCEQAQGIYNAGFENISILDIAKRVTENVPAEIIISPSNDPRSYRLNADNLLSTGFEQKRTVNDAIQEIIENFKTGRLKDDDGCYNIRTMKQIKCLQ